MLVLMEISFKPPPKCAKFKMLGDKRLNAFIRTHKSLIQFMDIVCIKRSLFNFKRDSSKFEFIIVGSFVNNLHISVMQEYTNTKWLENSQTSEHTLLYIIMHWTIYNEVFYEMQPWDGEQHYTFVVYSIYIFQPVIQKFMVFLLANAKIMQNLRSTWTYKIKI